MPQPWTRLQAAPPVGVVPTGRCSLPHCSCQRPRQWPYDWPRWYWRRTPRQLGVRLTWTSLLASAAARPGRPPHSSTDWWTFALSAPGNTVGTQAKCSGRQAHGFTAPSAARTATAVEPHAQEQGCATGELPWAAPARFLKERTTLPKVRHALGTRPSPPRRQQDRGAPPPAFSSSSHQPERRGRAITTVRPSPRTARRSIPGRSLFVRGQPWFWPLALAGTRSLLGARQRHADQIRGVSVGLLLSLIHI